MKIQFLPDVFNMNINKIAVVLIIKYVAPDMFIKLLPGKDFVPVQNQILKKIIFFPGQFNFSAGEGHPA